MSDGPTPSDAAPSRRASPPLVVATGSTTGSSSSRGDRPSAGLGRVADAGPSSAAFHAGEQVGADITVVGLGPGDPGNLTVAAREELAVARAVWVRTTSHPGLAAIPRAVPVFSCDDLYTAEDSFDAVYHAIAARLVDEAARGPLVYAVPGDPHVGETSVRYLLQAASRARLTVRVLPAVSFLEPTLAALGWDPFDGLQIADATTVGEQHHPQLDPGVPALVGQVYSRLVASDLKLTLLNQYPPQHPVTLVTGAGASPEAGATVASVESDSPVGLRVLTLPLCELDHQDLFDDLTTLAVPPLAFPGSLLQLAEAVAHLRAPDGCPWDLAQTHASLRPYLLEEAHEALAALDADDMPAVAEELGDLLLQVVLHAQIAVEEGEFTLSEVIGHITEKIWRRHPHVFGDAKADTVEAVLVNWEALKREERAKKGHADAEDPFSGIPVSLPALARAQAIQDRAERLALLTKSHADLAGSVGGTSATSTSADAAWASGATTDSPVASSATSDLPSASSASGASVDAPETSHAMTASPGTSGTPVDSPAVPLAGLDQALQSLRTDASDPDLRAAHLGEALWQLVRLARSWDLDAETALRETADAAIAAGGAR